MTINIYGMPFFVIYYFLLLSGILLAPITYVRTQHIPNNQFFSHNEQSTVSKIQKPKNI
jgi:hypothetical protein